MSEQRFTASTLVISYKAEKAGWYRLRLPVAMLKNDDYLVNCVIRSDGTQSRGMIIAKRHYRKGVAYIGYAGENVPADGGFMHTWVWDSTRIQMH